MNCIVIEEMYVQLDEISSEIIISDAIISQCAYKSEYNLKISLTIIWGKKSLKISKGQPEAAHRRTDNTMVYKTPHR